MNKLILIFTLLLLLGNTQSAPQNNIERAAAPFHSVAQWRVLEIDLISAKEYKDPFNQVEVNAVFTGPEGTTITRPAYWNGGKKWKIRFAPGNPGKWSMVTICSDRQNKGLHNQKTFIQCNAYTNDLEIYKRGFLQVSKNGRYFTYADGTPFFYLGDTHWLFIHERFDTSNMKGVASQFKYIVDKRVAQGFTIYQSEAIQQPHLKDNVIHTGADEEKACYFGDGFDESDLPGFANIDRKFKYIADKGLVHANSAVTWALDPTDKPEVYTNSYMSKLGRYWCARYGAYPVLWTIAQEIDKNMYGKYDSVTIGKWQALAQAIADNDAYHHPLGAHMENTSAVLASTSWWKNKSYHNWWPVQLQDDVFPLKTVKDFWNHDQVKPSILYETRYEGFWTNAKGARAAAYKAFQCGMFGYGYGANGVWNDIYSANPEDYGTGYEMPERYLNWHEGANLAGAQQLSYFKKFYKQLEWWKLIPRFDDSSWSRFADPARSLLSTDLQNTYVVYFFNDVKATGILRNMDPGENYVAGWFDPRTGKYSAIGTFTPAQRTWTIPQKPDDDDWILLVKKQNLNASNTVSSLSDFPKEKVIVGAIRWDAWIGDAGKGLNDASQVGRQVERSLSPNRYHYRAPFYSKVISHDSIQCRGTTSEIMDQEIKYAKHAGLDYWAFCWYPPGSGLDTARQLYLASKRSNEIKWCVILGTNPFDYDTDGAWLVKRFKDANYQKVVNGRPLVYIFGIPGAVLRSQLDQLRRMTAAAGVKAPYVVVMDFTAKNASALADTLAADALSSYISWVGKNGQPYNSVIPNADKSGWKSFDSTGKKIIPWVTAGHNTKPRIDNQVTWTNVPADNWIADGTPKEVAAHLANALKWVKENSSSVEANSVLIYAWNEFDEGGWLCPTLGEGTSRIDEIRKVLVNNPANNQKDHEVATDSGNSAKKMQVPVIGAIRWDAWHGLKDGVNDIVEKTLAPKEFHDRLPFFAKELTSDSVRIDGSSQEVMDQEIAYARYCGLDYWAFVTYTESSALSLMLKKYLSSSHRSDINFCAITEQGRFSRTDTAYINYVIRLMKTTGYQTVLNGRPLWYFGFINQENVNKSWGSFYNMKQKIDSIRNAIVKAGLKDPYIVIMDFDAKTGKKWSDSLGCDAISSYVALKHTNQGTYKQLTREVEEFWNDCKATSEQVVPVWVAGWNPKPRIVRPTPWYEYPKNEYYTHATPSELAHHIKTGLEWLQSNKESTEAQCAIIYSWNEYDEGGWLSPTLYEGTARIDSIGKVIREFRKNLNLPQNQ